MDARIVRAGWLTVCLTGWLASRWTAMAADPLPSAVDEEEAPLDVEFVRQRAEAGRPRAQMQLADFCLISGDATNAVVWYRKAAAQDEVGAQLALASCLITGRGAARNNQEAAHWLRRAAALIGGSNAVPAGLASASTATNHGPAAGGVAVVAPAVGAAAPVIPVRLPRAAGLQTNAPSLQALPAALRSYSEPR